MTQEQLLKYVEYIAIRYYTRHYKVFEKDAVSLDDLKQEAKLICLKIYKKYHKKHNVNAFDLKKFISRAVGWRLGDMLKGAIINSNNIKRYDDLVEIKIDNKPQEDNNNEDYINKDADREIITKDSKENFYDLLSNQIRYGFKIRDILIHFRGKNSIVLKKILEGKNIITIQKEMGYKNHNSVRDIINNNIRPKIEKILTKQLIEIKELSI